MMNVRQIYDHVLSNDALNRRVLGRPGWGLPASPKDFECEEKDGNLIFFKGFRSKLEITGTGNIVICDEVANGDLIGKIQGDGNVVLICAGPKVHLRVMIRGSNNLAYVGPDSMINSATIVVGDSATPISAMIGANALFSNRVSLRCSDSHGIFDCESGELVSTPESIIIEPHVWVGENVILLKGVHVGAGAVVGAGALVTSSLPPRTASVGMPARVIRTNVTWTETPQPEEADRSMALQLLATLDPPDVVGPIADALRRNNAPPSLWTAPPITTAATPSRPAMTARAEAARAARQAREAEALRANLRRRKLQGGPRPGPRPANGDGLEA